MLLHRLAAGAALYTGLLMAAPATTAQPAGLVVQNGRIVTLDRASTVESAMAVRDGRIVALGAAARADAMAGPETRIVDAGGRTVIAGLIDSHLHAIRAAPSCSTEGNRIGARTIAAAMA